MTDIMLSAEERRNANNWQSLSYNKIVPVHQCVKRTWAIR